MSQINETAIKTPGVYTTEIPLFPPSVAQVETAVPAFIGYTEKAMDGDGINITNVPTKIYSFKEYEFYFGKAVNETSISVDVFKNTRTQGTIVKTLSITAQAFNESPSPHNMYYSLRLYFDNGGGPCYIISVGSSTAVQISDTDLLSGLEKLEAFDEPTLIVFPEGQNIGTDSSKYYALVGKAIDQCAKLQDRFTLVDVYDQSKTTDQNMTNFRTDFAHDSLNYAAAYYPNLKTTYDYQLLESEVNVNIIENSLLIKPYEGATSYAVNALVKSNGKVYKSLVANNKAQPLADNTKWEQQNGILPYNAATSFATDDIVSSDNTFYVSLVNTNQGNLLTDTSKWEEIADYLGTSYSIGDLVRRADGIIFKSKTDNNAGIAPATGVNWEEITSISDYAGGSPYAKDDLVKSNGKVYKSLQDANINHPVTDNSFWLVIGEAGTEGNIIQITAKMDSLLKSESGIYYACKTAISKLSPTLPPSPAMVGIYAKVDGQRGVWKAPANLPLSGIYDVTDFVTDEEQAGMNVDVNAGKSVNAIRPFNGKGILVWGARTLDGNSNEWRFVPVRRFFIMVEESAKKATFPFVFEPNDANTWVKVRAMLENYLTVLWRQGALAGAKPEHAFFVKCGLGSTMTAQDILNGLLIVEIGMAAVRPAEFIILRFMHKLQES